MEKNKIFSEKIIRAGRTYFIDVKESKLNELYLTLTESKKTSTGYEYQTVIVFKEDINDFSNSLNKAFLLFKEEENEKEEKKYSVEKIRKLHKNAYMKWSQMDDDKLEIMYSKNLTIEKIASFLGRNIGAINSRIAKLELNKKYNM